MTLFEKRDVTHEAITRPTQQSWEQICKNENIFTDRRLHEFPAKFKNFYKEQAENSDKTMKDLMDSILKTVYDHYSPQDAEMIVKMYIFSCVLTQYNEKKGENGESKTVRKAEFDENGIAFPAFIHPSRMLLEALNEKPAAELDILKPERKKGVNAVTAMAIAGHDLVEDCEMNITKDNEGKQVEWKISGKKEGKTITIEELIGHEFPDVGHRVMTQINAVTKYDFIPTDLENAMNESGIKLYLDKTLLSPKGRSTKKTKEKSKEAKDNEKAITSVYRIRSEPYKILLQNLAQLKPSSPDFQSKKAQLLEEYYQDVVAGIYIKCRDTLDNGPGISRASQIRARQLATLARLIGFYEISNDLMIMLAQKVDNPFIQDRKSSELAAFLTKERRRTYNEKLQQMIFEQSGLSTSVETGLRIKFSEEDVDDMYDKPVPQTIITVPHEYIEFFKQRMTTIINTPEFEQIMGGQPPYTSKGFEGILEKTTRIWGREGEMIRVMDTDKKTVFYIRIVDNKPTLSDYIMQDHAYATDSTQHSPEESIFRPPQEPSQDVSDEERFLHASLFYLYPEFLRIYKPAKGGFKNLFIVVWKNGFTTVKGLPNDAKSLCSELGLVYSNPVLTDFENGNGHEIDPKNPPALPILRLRDAIRTN